MRTPISSRTYPTAITPGPEVELRTSIDLAITWALQQQRSLGGQILVRVPNAPVLREHPKLAALVKSHGAMTGTSRTRTWGWNGGPVIAAWLGRDEIGELAEDGRTRALVVLPWLHHEVAGWVAAAEPECLGGAPELALGEALDPVAEQAMETATILTFSGDSVRREYAVAVLLALRGGGHPIQPDAMYAWALRRGWQQFGAERFRELAMQAASGKGMRIGRPNPIRPD